MRDFSAWGTDGTTSHITLPCDSDFRVGDVVNLFEEDGGNLDSAYTASTFSLLGTLAKVSRVLLKPSVLTSPVAATPTAATPSICSAVLAPELAPEQSSGGEGAVTAGCHLLSAGSGYKHTDQLSFSLPRQRRWKRFRHRSRQTSPQPSHPLHPDRLLRRRRGTRQRRFPLDRSVGHRKRHGHHSEAATAAPAPLTTTSLPTSTSNSLSGLLSVESVNFHWTSPGTSWT